MGELDLIIIQHCRSVHGCSGSERTNTDGRKYLQMAPLMEDLYQDIQRTSKLKKSRIHFFSGQETLADRHHADDNDVQAQVSSQKCSGPVIGN